MKLIRHALDHARDQPQLSRTLGCPPRLEGDGSLIRVEVVLFRSSNEGTRHYAGLESEPPKELQGTSLVREASSTFLMALKFPGSPRRMANTASGA